MSEKQSGANEANRVFRKTLVLCGLCAATFSFLAVAPASARDIERACIASERSPGQRTLCGCIQQAANRTLSLNEQRRAAAFFDDPHQAQVVRQSDRPSDERFWQRYKEFGRVAEVYCS